MRAAANGATHGLNQGLKNGTVVGVESPLPKLTNLHLLLLQGQPRLFELTFQLPDPDTFLIDLQVKLVLLVAHLLLELRILLLKHLDPGHLGVLVVREGVY